MIPPRELSPERLQRRCDTSKFSYTSTADAPELEGIIGQERATRAIEFGIEIANPGYNIFAMGPAGAGKTSIITRFLERKAATREVPPDWGYVHNFTDPDRPRAVRLPPGGGTRLRAQVDALLVQVAEALGKSFASDQYAESRNTLGRDLDHQRSERFRQLEALVREHGFTLARSPMGMMVVPAPGGKGQPITPEQFDALPEAERQTYAEQSQALQEMLERTIRQVRELEETAQERLDSLDREMVAATVRPLFDRLVAEYQSAWPDAASYLQGIQAHLSEHADEFKRRSQILSAANGQPPESEEGDAQAADASQPAPSATPPPSTWLRSERMPAFGAPYNRYRLNVVVDNQPAQSSPGEGPHPPGARPVAAEDVAGGRPAGVTRPGGRTLDPGARSAGLRGAPVIVETNPTYANLLGWVDMRAEFGTLVTDYRDIRAGSLHRANGGYLLLDARVLLGQPMAWEALKQALRNRRVRIEDIGRQLGVLTAATLMPEPIPLDVKVVLIGDPATYYLLYAYDEQFEKLFKVRADFAVEMDWSEEAEEQIARFIRHQCVEEGLPHFDLSAVAEVIEYSAREIEDQRKLTTRFAHVSDIVVEAAFWARQAGHSLVTSDDVVKAIEERVFRSNQFEERMREMITDGFILVDTTGSAIGQVNGLAVIALGDYTFGRPTRITARTFQGRTGVVNIEREARLSGRIHDKGVLILSGFLGGRFAQDRPLTLSASVAFEQSYEGIDGDSASSAELYALLSSLADLPVKQGIAVTGSVNQNGQIQAIGGATAKIEGFFDVCRAMPGGLTGDQGVILPEANLPSLMLRDDLVEAVTAGQFHVYPVRSVDEGIEILTGVPAGERGPAGDYPEGTVNGRVDRKLRKLAERLQPLQSQPAGSGWPSEANGTREPPPGKQPPMEPDLPGDIP